MRYEMHSNSTPCAQALPQGTAPAGAPVGGASGAPAGTLDAVRWVGSGLVRPECVLTTARGDLYTADWRGGVAHVRPDGSQTLYRGHPVDGETLRPNGIALQPDGSFLLAHLGERRGGVFRLQRDGSVSEFLARVDGVDLPPTNFVVGDHHGRHWITVSTRKTPRALGYRPGDGDGFVVMVDARGARIVADGLGYTNECAVSADGQSLYVNETFARRLSRFALRADGSLGPRETVTEFGHGTYPDGLALDVQGDAWITSIVSNRLIRVDAQGRQTVWLEDADAAHLQWVEQAYRAGTMDRPHLDGTRSRLLRNVSSLAFGGAQLRTGHLGCLLGDAIGLIDMPVAGLPPVHWRTEA